MVQYFGWVWMAFSTNAGGKCKDGLKNKTSSNKTVLFSLLLTGTINWMAYRAFLTSELSAVKITYPFNNMETMLSTNFRQDTEMIVHNT